ncbi:hypothetical protein J4418_00570 [Candidatus Woesearchaeota archaeon]|nr:hypothetical protein [Candidatus Woesearchaeota archaeon]
MQYKDDNGKNYEISYSQKLQREQNKLLKQKNRLLMVFLVMMFVFALGGAYLYIRLETINFLTDLMHAVRVFGMS